MMKKEKCKVGFGRVGDICEPIFYHGTPCKRADSIMKEGFKPTPSARGCTVFGLEVNIPCESPFFFFTKEKKKAYSWGENRSEWGEDSCVIASVLSMEKPLDFTSASKSKLREFRNHLRGQQVSDEHMYDNGFDPKKAKIKSKSLFTMMFDNVEAKNALKSMGYDGVILDEGKNDEFGGISYAIYDGRQAGVCKWEKDLVKGNVVGEWVCKKPRRMPIKPDRPQTIIGEY